MMKQLKVKYGLKTPSMLKNKHTGIENRWFYSSFSEHHPLLLDNGMMSYSCLNIELLEIMEQGRTWTNLKMVIMNYIKQKPVGSNAPPLVKKWESIPTCIIEDDDEAVDCNT